MEDYEDAVDMPDAMDYGHAPYMFEPEYTDEELREMEQQQQAEINNNSSDVGQTRQRHLEPSHLWCKCTKCAIMGTDDECLCCAEFFLWHPDVAEGESEDAPTPCVTSSDDFPSIINRGVLETFFLSKRINWEERPEPEGENGHLSNE